MKTKLFIIAALLCLCSTTFAGFITGSMLTDSWKAWKNAESGTIQSNDSTGFYSGYVAGIADAFGELLFDIPAGVNLKQIKAIVSKYIDDNPTEWNKPAKEIVINALKKAFPKK